jgi:hypothetical protein
MFHKYYPFTTKQVIPIPLETLVFFGTLSLVLSTILWSKSLDHFGGSIENPVF